MNDRGVGIESLNLFLGENPSYKVYDYSQERAWDMCNQRYAFRYVHQLAESTGAAALLSTHIVHPMVADFYEAPNLSAVRNEISPNASNAARQRWETRWTNFIEASYGATRSRAFDNIFTLPSMMRAFDLLGAQRTRDHDAYSYYGTEMLYWRVFPGVDNAVWVAKPDVVLQRREDHALVTVEVKMSQYTTNRAISMVDRQLLSQAWTAEPAEQIRLFFQLDVGPVSRSTGEAQRIVRLTDNVIVPDKDLLAEWVKARALKIRAMQAAAAAGVYPKSAPDACHEFNRACPWIDICPLGGTAQEFAVENAEHSNPLEYLGL